MGLRITAAQAARLASASEKTVRSWITSGKLRATKQQEAGHPASWSIDTDDLAALPGVTIDRERLAELEAGRSRSPVGILARLEAAEREIAALRTRVRLLESENAARSFTTSATHSLESPTPTPEHISQAHQSESLYSRDPVQPGDSGTPLAQSMELPNSVRGRATWVEFHSGPKATGVRDWPEIRNWQTIEDVIASVRRRRGWENWTPV